MVKGSRPVECHPSAKPPAAFRLCARLLCSVLQAGTAGYSKAHAPHRTCTSRARAQTPARTSAAALLALRAATGCMRSASRAASAMSCFTSERLPRRCCSACSPVPSLTCRAAVLPIHGTIWTLLHFVSLFYVCTVSTPQQLVLSGE